MRLSLHPMTRATRPRWLLEELGAPYELEIVDVYKGEGKRPEDLLETHPHGAVPALTDGDLTLIESSAICLYLADQHAAGGLAPPLGSAERGRYYQSMVSHSVATAEPPVLRSCATPSASRTRRSPTRGARSGSRSRASSI